MGMRADLERMVDQIEAETAAEGVNNGKGRLPSFFYHLHLRGVQMAPTA